MENQNLSPDEQDIDSFSVPVQNFAFGGIANPVQRAMLRGSDKQYLDARQKELDAFETQRLAYNDALTKYQNEVYNPYKAQTEAYNAAAQKYNEEIYNPYKTQYDAYEKAINEWNAGGRTTDYAGPAAPTLSKTFDMTAPKDPEAFTMQAPTVPFKEEEVQAYQQAAGDRARKDAASRAVAIDVVSNPDQFNFGSMSVANRFMADGGEVKAKPKGKSAKEMLGEMDGGYEPDDAATQPQPASKDTASVKPGSAYYESPEYKAFMKANSDPMIARDMAMYRSQYFGEVGSRGLGREMDKAYESYLERVAREAKEAPPTSVAPPPVITPPPPPPPPVVRDPRSAGVIQGPVGSSAQLVNRTVNPLQATTPAAAMLNTLNAANPLAKVDLSGRISSPTGGRTQQPGMQPVARGPENSSGGDIPITAPTMPVYSDRGVGAVGDVGGINIQGPAIPMFGNSRLGSATTSPNNPNNYFGISQPGQQGISPGTTAIGSPDMPMYGAMNTMGAIGQNSNLSPTMLGGAQNAGVMTDRLGNRIYAPGMGPLFGPPGFAKGGLADVNEFNMADAEDEEPINTDPAGSARKLLADLTGPTQSVTEVTESPTAKSIKRVSKKTSGGGGGTPKGMSMEYESLTSAKDLVPQLKDDGSARSQMEALALAYKLRAQQATDKSRGLMRNTLGAPTLEQPTLTKGRLTAKRFEKGGEAKKSMGGETEVSASEGLPAPGLMNATLWADTVSRDMYPSEREYTKRDAARHMLAAAIMANKTSPGIAEGLGKFHEFKEAPFRTAGHWLGVSEPRGDYRTDVHNNALGAALADAAKDPRQLERMVRQAIKGGSSTGIEKGRVSLTPDDLSNMGYGGIQPGVAVSQERMRRKAEQEPAKRAKGGAVAKPKKKAVGS